MMSTRNWLARVVEARHVRRHVIWLKFDDGLEGEVDLLDGIRGEVLEPLLDENEFARARVEDGTLVWPSGADWAPEDLYERVAAATRSGRQQNDDGFGASVLDASSMPEISRFYGIVIRMLANDHVPPHFHATYGDYGISVTIRDNIVSGRFPRRALRLVLEWSDLHHEELLTNWERLRAGGTPLPIEPLP
jgi:hypothetical protein